MQLKNFPMYAAKLVCALFCADILTMLLMNIGRLYTHWLPVLFFGIFAILAFWIFRGQFIPPAQTTYLPIIRQQQLTCLALIAGFILAGVRVPYLLEGHLHHLVGPIVYDDTWHFQEINSLVNSIRYPAHCSLIPSRYFSLYYAPWMFISAIYLAIPINGFTIKAAFAIGCAIYQVLVCLALLYIGMMRARSLRHLYWAIYMTAFWAGMESIFSLMYYLRHNQQWLIAPEMPIHFPVFFTGIVWAPHHMTSAIALILCWHVWDLAQEKSWSAIGCCSLLIAYAFYSSVFVFLGALPIALFLAIMAMRKDRNAVLSIAFVSGALIWPMLWIYMGKSHDVRFLFPFIESVRSLFPFMESRQFQSAHHIPATLLTSAAGIGFGFLVFAVFICLNFFPHTVALVYCRKRLNGTSLILASIAVLFIVSTYFIGFPEGDNYASRGYIIPIILLSWICAGILPPIRCKPWVILGLCVGAFGLVHEGIQTYKHSFSAAHTPMNANYGSQILKMNQDRHTRTVSAAAVSGALLEDPNLIYYIEKFVDGGKSQLVVGDRQLECAGPNGPWRWQQIPNK